MDSTSSIFFDMFDTLIRHILTYGSDVWGLSKAGLDVLDKVFLNFVRCTLNVKATTCNAIVYGECGRYPLSVFCHINVLCHLHRLLTMPGERIVKSVFHTLGTLHGHGFTTWATKAYDLAQLYEYRCECLCCAHSKTIWITVHGTDEICICWKLAYWSLR